MFNNIRAKRKGLLLFTTLAALLTGLVGYLLMHRLQTESVQSVQHNIEAGRIALTLFRWTLITLVALSWNRLIAWLASVGAITHTKIVQLAELRWRVVIWLVLLELVLGQGALVKAVSLAAGTVL